MLQLLPILMLVLAFLATSTILLWFVVAEKSRVYTPSFIVSAQKNEKLIIAFRGLNGIMDDASLIYWAKANGYDVKIFQHYEMNKASSYLSKVKYKSIEILGFSKGAETAYAFCKSHKDRNFERLLTIGTYHTVTSSFGYSRLPLKNVTAHLNFIEKHQQPKGFEDNAINISLGPTIHFDAVKKTLKMLDKFKETGE